MEKGFRGHGRVRADVHRGTFNHQSPYCLSGFIGLVHVRWDVEPNKQYGREVFYELARGKCQWGGVIPASSRGQAVPVRANQPLGLCTRPGSLKRGITSKPPRAPAVTMPDWKEQGLFILDIPVRPELVEGPPVHGSTGSPRTDLADRMENEKALAFHGQGVPQGRVLRD